MLYQTLIGVWPAGTDSTADSLAAVAADILPRVEGWLVKALREGKRRSNWWCRTPPMKPPVPRSCAPFWGRRRSFRPHWTGSCAGLPPPP
ncbi:hypothetical protein ACFQ4K_33755 [Tistrella bauzanensis]